MLLSVIVAVYNVENYLRKCIQSIIDQQYENLEIILVDDGSTDASGAICDEFKKQDSRIKVLHTVNKGAATARKLGVSNANGKYIAFVDSDDWIEPEMYQEMMKLCTRNDADLVTSGLLYEWPDKSRIMTDSIEEGIYGKKEIQKHIIPRLIYNGGKNAQGITASASNKIYKKELLKRFIDRIDEKIVLGEDAALIYPYVALVEKIVVTHKCWYHYIQHDGSVMRSASLASFEALYALEKYFYDFFRKYDFFKDIELQIKHYVGAFINDTVRSVYNISMCKIYFVFPYELVPQNSKVILYGAGRVGISYWNSIKNGSYATVISWVDGNYQNVFMEEAVLEAPESISEKEFDYVVIAVEEERAKEAIRNKLIGMGVDEKKIVWKINHINVYS